MPTVGGYELHSIPIKVPQDQSVIIDKVKELIEIDDDSPRTTELRKEIDHFIYRLYCLSYDDVLVIDKEFALTREQYEKYCLEA